MGSNGWKQEKGPVLEPRWANGGALETECLGRSVCGIRAGAGGSAANCDYGDKPGGVGAGGESRRSGGEGLVAGIGKGRVGGGALGGKPVSWGEENPRADEAQRARAAGLGVGGGGGMGASAVCANGGGG